MANNGNDPRLEKLSDQLRNVPAGVPALDPVAVMPAGAKAPATYDFMVRMQEAAQAARDIAAYSTDFAEHIEKATGSYVASMHKLLGKLGK